MTLKEKMRELYPDMVDDSKCSGHCGQCRNYPIWCGGVRACPLDFTELNACYCCPPDCVSCWNREWVEK